MSETEVQVESFEELSRKAHAWREWYYSGEPKPRAGTEPVQDVFEHINAVLFGHIYQREDKLDVRTRSLCTIAALVVLDRHRQLPGHITGALNIGVSKEEILELITQLLFYGGYPCTVNALNAAIETFETYTPTTAPKPS
ncbi:MAG: carboxymuconolactone decarboxylase family protein [Chloroflexota bacterium]